ncbi:MAG: succinylglutamate desuccinylase/aspartoacylase family protein [Acidobacteriota bacterium]|jgi:hypothetical protein
MPISSRSSWGPILLGARRIAPGATAEIRLEVSESYTADPLYVPVTVVRGHRAGPTLFLTAAVHGDELNGVAVVRDLLNDQDFADLSGTLIAVPVVNVPGFLNQTRYLPDRRDLNRSFPGNPEGSFTSRLAHRIYEDVLRVSDFGLDLHTAGHDRANYPHVRGDLNNPAVAELASAFGAELTIHGAGPSGALRRAAVDAGVPTIVYEAGSARVFERRFIDIGIRGALNVLRHLGMLTGEPRAPELSFEVKRSVWLRAGAGGILDLRTSLGEPVRKHQVLSVNANPFGRERHQIEAPAGGVVIGLTRSPLVHPGDAVCHLARLPVRAVSRWRERWEAHECLGQHHPDWILRPTGH